MVIRGGEEGAFGVSDAQPQLIRCVGALGWNGRGLI